MVLKLFSRPKDKVESPRTEDRAVAESVPAKPVAVYKPAPVENAESDPLRAMLLQERFATLLRGRELLEQHCDAKALTEQAVARLEQSMALVPQGIVTMTQTLSAAPGDAEEDVEIAPFLLDTHAVTNARFQKFVDGGGYEDLELWPEDIWPHLIEMQDATGKTAPRFWRGGRHDHPLSDHPVVGVSWFEANAYARWIGQHLPTEAQWQMASSWHIKSSADILRRFPWGDGMDVSKCNIWATGRGSTSSVNDFPTGAAPNRVLQLIGNVWEWTTTEFEMIDDDGNLVFGEMPMFAIRGGAYDTYFESQVVSDFRTGQISLARAHNVGFRCAMDLSDADWLG